MLKCREITRLVASGELDDAPWTRRMAAWLHLLMCRHCRRYERQVEDVDDAARAVLGSCEPSAATLERLERRILEPRVRERRTDD